MKKLRVTLTSLGVAAGILVGGYTIVNRLPVNGLSVGNPITNDDIKTYSVTDTTYDTLGGEPTVTERYESIKGINNRIKYDSYTPTHKTTNSDGKDKYFRQHTTFTLDDLTDDEINSNIHIDDDYKKDDKTSDEIKDGSYTPNGDGADEELPDPNKTGEEFDKNAPSMSNEEIASQIVEYMAAYPTTSSEYETSYQYTK